MGKGILLLFISPYREGEKAVYYLEESNHCVEFEGIQTNDAPVKYLMDYACSQGDRIDKIICIVSENVKKKGFQEFQQMVRDYVSTNDKLAQMYQDSEILFCPVDYDEEKESTAERTFQIYNQLSKALLSETEANIYIDYTGGLRDISFFMTVVIRYLEYQNLKCRKIVYSKKLNQQNACTIHTIDCIYDLFTLINGVDQFVRTGNADLLGECYENEQDAETKKLLALIIRFSKVMSICDVQQIEKIRPQISDGLQKYGKNRIMKSVYLEMFADMTAVIRKKLYIGEHSTLTYPDLIRWCLDNNMIQQALTLYIEKMPQYYYEQKLLKKPESMKAVENGQTEETTAFYVHLYDDRVKDKSIERFASAIKKLVAEKRTASIEDLREMKRTIGREEQIATDRLIRFLKTNFENGMGRRMNFIANVYGLKGTNLAKNFRTGADALTLLAANADRWEYQVWLHSFMYDNREKYFATRYGTYERKVVALEKVRNTTEPIPESRVSREKLYQMMKYYCALKIMRNKMNHASEKADSTDERKAIELLDKKHGIVVKRDFDTIVSLLRNGINAHK